ncbi:MAG: insulinase family protein [Acidimicrobiaceae bacterium]|nr:insulinase family protein [Acidimicrobiaceae bacterium]
MKARTNKTVLAFVLAIAVIAAACADDPIEEEPTVSEPPETTEAPAEEPEGDDTADEPDQTATEESDEADSAATDQPTEPADLGAFNDYEPDEPDDTPLSIDSEVEIGTFDNGLTYYFRSNDSPAGHVSMRLVVNAGAVLDPSGQEGTAHFLEHMLFNGTEKFSKLELRQALRDLGIEFGPDLNAYTSADETVYMLDFQLDDPEALDLAFTVFSEWASAATLDPAEVEAERGIVLDEYRLTDQSANGWIGNFLDAIYYSGTVYEGMLLGGSEASNSSITAEQLRDFYETWYRPDNMALVVVGDLPVAEMAQKAEQFLGGLTNPADPMPPQPERNAFTADFVDEPVIDVATHPDYGFISMSIDWQLPAWSPRTVGGDRLRWMEAVIAHALDVRLANAHRAGLMAQADEPAMWLWQQARGLRLYGTNIEGTDLAQATTDYLSVLAGAAHYGFTDDELDQAATAARTSLDYQLEREPTIQSAGHADRYTSNFVNGGSIESVEDRVARLEALLDTFTVEELTAHLRWILDNAPPLVVPLGDDPANVPDIAQLQAAIDAVVPVPPPPTEDRIETLLTTPDPVVPIREHPVGLFEGAHEWVFANGAHVVFAPSDLAAGHVAVSARSLGGWSQLPMGSAAMRRAITGAVANSGVADYSASQLDAYLAGTTARLTPYITELTEGFTGFAGPDDLDDLLALMHLYITEPRVTEVSAAEQIQDLRIRRTNYENNPQWTAVFDLYDATYQNSPWYHFILTHEEIDAVTAEGLLDLYEARLDDVDDLLVVIVGDIDQATVAVLAARYIGTLPAGEADAHVSHNPGFPPGISRITTPVDADSGAAGLYLQFGAAVPVTAETLVIADLVSTLLDDLLVGSVREDLGETYSVGVVLTPFIEVGLWDAYFSASGPSESLEQINSTIVATVAELIADGPTDDGLAQAKAVLRDDYQLDSNDEIISPLLMRRHLDDALVGTPDQRLALLDEITAEDISRYVALFFNLDNRIEAFRSVQ